MNVIAYCSGGCGTKLGFVDDASHGSPNKPSLGYCVPCSKKAPRRKASPEVSVCSHQRILEKIGREVAELEEKIVNGKVSADEAVMNLASILKALSP